MGYDIRNNNIIANNYWMLVVHLADQLLYQSYGKITRPYTREYNYYTCDIGPQLSAPFIVWFLRIKRYIHVISVYSS